MMLTFLFTARGRHGLTLAALLVLALSGCFKDPHLDLTKTRTCQSDNDCPKGFLCGTSKTCCRSSDGRSCDAVDASISPDNEGGVDSSNRETAADTADGSARREGGIDTGPGASSDASTEPVAQDTAQTVVPEPDADQGAGGAGGVGSTPSDGGTDMSGSGGAGGSPGIDAGKGDVGIDVPVGGFGGGLGGNGGSVATGGTTTSTGGTSATGGSGTSSTNPCGGTTKLCNGSCIPLSSCCGGCSGDKPVCSNGTCVARALGDTCTLGTECATGVCADGVCCNVACDGQCESCALPTSKGTCTPTTTQRTPCTGTGVCAGICDGTAQHRESCTYPDDQTSCGSSASCINGYLTTAALCNGAGSCNVSTSSTCTYGCRTDGTVGCATSCPAGQGLCGGACVDVLSSPTHCGGACAICESTTPKCFSGSCVQCLTGPDCVALGFGSGSECSANHTCQCRPASASNLVKNGGFSAASGLTNWTGNPLSTISTDDADGCSDSRSVKLDYQPVAWGLVKQCVTVSPSTTYWFGLRHKGLGGKLDAHVMFFPGSTCSGSNVAYINLPEFTGDTFWTSSSVSATIPATAGSAEVYVQVSGTVPIWVDSIYLNTANSY